MPADPLRFPTHLERAKRLLEEGGERCWEAVDEIGLALREAPKTERQIADGIGRSRFQVRVYLEMLDSQSPNLIKPAFEEAYREAAEKLRNPGRREREERLRRERAEAIEAARASGRLWTLEVADVRKWRPEGVAAIVTDPPYITKDAVELYSALADFAVDVLPEGGALATLTWQPILADVIVAMQRPELRFRWVIAWLNDTHGAVTYDMRRRVHDAWKPVLVYHKGEWPSDAESIRDTIESEGRVADDHVWQQSLAATAKLVSYVSTAGDLVCDPFAGSGTTGIAALGLERDFIGADIDANAVATAHVNLGGLTA